MKNLSIEMPSVAEVGKYLKIWRESELPEYEKYRQQENIVVKLFREQYPKNAKLDEVLIKVCVLNDFYSTNIRDVYPVALNIVKQDIDGKLANKSIDIIDDIARVTIKEKEWRYYSFATKYCSHHYPDDYPIYDSFVSKVLTYFKEEFYKSEIFDLRNYESFKDVILVFRKHYELEKFSLRELDLYLWILGKKYFSPPKNDATTENE